MKVKVWNDHHEDYTEKFKGRTMLVPAGKFIEMERAEAIQFRGTFSGVDSESGMMKPKLIRIEEDAEQRKLRLDQPMVTLKCQACGRDFLSQEELATHIKVHHKDAQIKDEGKNGKIR